MTKRPILSPRPALVFGLLLGGLLCVSGAQAQSKTQHQAGNGIDATAGSGGPKIQHWTVDGGMRVYFVPTEDSLPLVDMSLMFDAGSARDGHLPGLSSITSSLLSEGSGGLDAGAVARLFEDQGAQFSAGSGRDSTTISLRSLSDADTLQASVKALADVISKPDFTESAVERERSRMLVALQSAERNPGAIANKAFWEASYGDHPYASPPEGTRDSIGAISRDDIRAFHERHYVGSNATLALVGDISRDQANALALTIAETLAEALGEGEPPAALPAVTMPGEAKTIRIPFNSSQTHILMGHPGYARGNEAHYALFTGNHILGGNGLVSRLAEEMRENRGLSYSVSSNFSPMRGEGPFLMRTQVRTDRTGEARQVLLEALADIRDHGPSEEEVNDSVRNITGGFPLNLDSNGKIAGFVGTIGFFGLPLDYLDTFSGRIEAVDRDGIRNAFQRHVHPDRLITVIVGPEEEADE